MLQTLRASPVFALAVLLTLALAVLNGAMVVLMQLFPGFMGMAHFSEPHHRIHDLTFGFIFLPAVVGMLAQLRRPAENVAGQAMALVPWAALLLTLIAARVSADGTGRIGGLGNLAWFAPAASTLVAALLHPTWSGFFRSFRVSRISWTLLALVAIATAPLLVFAFTSVGIQATIADDHAAAGHYGFMAAFAFTVIGVGLLASLRADGWRLTAWVAGLLPVLLGIASLVYPDISSTLGPMWAIAALAWGVVFVAAAERARVVAPTPSRAAAGDAIGPPSTTIAAYPGRPAWVTAAGGTVLLLVLLVVGSFLTGTSLGGAIGHRPPAGGHR